MRCLALAGILLRTCSAVFFRPDGRGDHEAMACRDAAPGEWCHAAVRWAMETGHQRRPDWFPGDASQYSMRDFQALLHELGEAECPRPCPEDSGGQRLALALIQIQSSTVQSLAATFGLRAAEFDALMESSWEPKTRAGSLYTTAAGQPHRTGCHDTQPGSLCYHAVEWLHDRGLAKYPAWYPSLSEDSTMQEVQSVLHTLGKAGCPKPCQVGIAKRLEQSPDDMVLEVDDNGRQVLSEAYELADTSDCGDAMEGDWCYLSIQWLKNTGLDKHPDWYPTLTRDSSIGVFQTVLHRQGKMGCPLPCSSDSDAAEPVEELTTSRPEPTAEVSPNALRVRSELEECEDAKRDSSCDRAVTRVLNTGLWLHPEEYPELNPDCSRAEVQEHLFLRGQFGCARPCPKVHVAKHLRARRVKKRVEDMTAEDLTRFLNREWDGYVNSDEYDEYDEYEYRKVGAAAAAEAKGAGGPPAAAAAADGPAAQDSAGAAPAEGAGVAGEAPPAAAEGAPAAEAAADVEEGVGAEALPAVSNETAQEASEAQGLSPAEVADECRDARAGELCYQAVTWAMTKGILERPAWYPELSARSSFKEFQAHLHQTRGSLCPRPCAAAAEAPSAQGPTTEEPRATAAGASQAPVANDSAPDAGRASGEHAEQSTGGAGAASGTVAADSAAHTEDHGPAPKPDPEAADLWRPEAHDDTSEEFISEELLPVVDRYGRAGGNASNDPLQDVEQGDRELDKLWSTSDSTAAKSSARPVNTMALLEHGHGHQASHRLPPAGPIPMGLTEV
ncbi:unnamed protein product [Prorocentrum cordatum]|uniref:Uncharacterized protein n=1 Tax=Prorocentrum cordatum TaxID=2364126 RepID=A0ABN9TUN4_9DINO|nr:unnamed protein product [Polarella glacialis]